MIGRRVGAKCGRFAPGRAPRRRDQWFPRFAGAQSACKLGEFRLRLVVTEGHGQGCVVPHAEIAECPTLTAGPATSLVVIGRTESSPNPRRCPDCGGWVWAVAGRVFPEVCPRCMAEFRGGVATPLLGGGRRRSRPRPLARAG